MTDTRSLTTKAVRRGLESDAQYGAVVPPIYLSTNYTFDGYNGKRKYDYTRSGNPTRDVLGEALADLEGGFGAVITSTGMAAVNLCLQLLNPGDLMIAPHDCYGGTHRLFTHLARRGHFEVQFIDLTQADALDELERDPNLVWIETPSNPLLRLTDVRKTAKAAKARGAIVVVDNTFLSPALQQPLNLGADLVVHSTTKYINGHSDVVGGAVVSKTEDLHEIMTWWANCLGITGAPFDSFLTLRGLRTLGVRMRAHVENATAIAQFLNQHPAVEKVYYPGLADHPQLELACLQQPGFGAMISFELKGGIPAVQALVANLRCFSLAESLGGVESLIAHPATMTHAAMEPEARRTAGIQDNLLRISVGIEELQDLINDLDFGLSLGWDHQQACPVTAQSTC
ncbi:MAG: cystathionine gamma-synthase [Acidobacteria bacterium]|nr:cystathionine gamma-synthase [Acidobacteriota bacterium]